MSFYRIYHFVDGELVSSIIEAKTPYEAVKEAISKGIKEESINSVYSYIPNK